MVVSYESPVCTRKPENSSRLRLMLNCVTAEAVLIGLAVGTALTWTLFPVGQKYLAFITGTVLGGLMFVSCRLLIRIVRWWVSTNTEAEDGNE